MPFAEMRFEGYINCISVLFSWKLLDINLLVLSSRGRDKTNEEFSFRFWTILTTKVYNEQHRYNTLMGGLLIITNIITGRILSSIVKIISLSDSYMLQCSQNSWVWYFCWSCFKDGKVLSQVFCPILFTNCKRHVDTS